MTELRLPWIEISVLVPLAGALWMTHGREAQEAWKAMIVFTGLALVSTVLAWQDFQSLHVTEAHDRWDILAPVLGHGFFVVDQLSAPLLPLAALLYLLTVAATAATKLRRFSFGGTLTSEAILLATLGCREGWGIVVLLVASVVPPYFELRARHKSTRVFTLHMVLFAACLIAGWTIASVEGTSAPHSMWAVGLLLVAVFVRSGIVPLHCWMTDLFERATFGTALLFVTPMAGAYAAVRLVLPIAPDWALRSIGLVSLATAVYAAGMALVQREARRYFCYLLISHSALVLVGLEIATPLGLTGALCVWLSVALCLTGYGLTLRGIEARTGRLSLADYHGLYGHIPTFAAIFLLTGLASVGFPGTFGFVGTELLVEGVVAAYPWVGMAVVAAAALNGIAVVRAYFLLFTGTRHSSSINLQSRGREQFAVLALAVLIFGGGLFPQPGVASRHQAALDIVRARQTLTESPAIEMPTGRDCTARVRTKLLDASAVLP